MATTSPTPAKPPFKIRIQIVNGLVAPVLDDYVDKMVVGDTASFAIEVTPPPTSVEIAFTPVVTTDMKGNPVSLVPFETDVITNPKPEAQFTVKNSCKAMMKPTMTTVDGRRVHCRWDERGNVTGQIVCTGGGNNPVHC